MQSSLAPFMFEKSKKPVIKTTTCDTCYYEIDINYSFKFDCNHVSCKYCLRKLFKKASKDNEFWPLQCCKKNIDLELAKKVLSKKSRYIFNQKNLEINSKKKMYCQNIICSQFICLDSVTTDLVKCTKCGTSNCTICKRSAPYPSEHGKNICSHGQLEEEKQLEALILAENWKKCPECNQPIELSRGCNHIICKCGTHFCYFCYNCNKQYKGIDGSTQACNCSMWQNDEQLLRVVEERRQRAAETNVRRTDQEIE